MPSPVAKGCRYRNLGLRVLVFRNSVHKNTMPDDMHKRINLLAQETRRLWETVVIAQEISKSLGKPLNCLGGAARAQAAVRDAYALVREFLEEYANQDQLIRYVFTTRKSYRKEVQFDHTKEQRRVELFLTQSYMAAQKIGFCGEYRRWLDVVRYRPKPMW